MVRGKEKEGIGKRTERQVKVKGKQTDEKEKKKEEKEGKEIPVEEGKGGDKRRE